MKQLFAILVLLPLAAQAQLGGRHAFPFLELSPSAQVAALGGMTASARSSDPSQFLASPALLSADMDGAVGVTYVGYVGGIKQGTVAYAFDTEKRGRFGLGMTYLNYGTLDSFDANGNPLGTFSVSEYALAAADSYTWGKFTAGTTVKLAVSGLAGNRAVGLAADAGVLYKPRPEQDLTVGLVVRNAGYMLKPYTAAAREPLPLDVQLGLTVKPEHMPFRFTLTAHHLQQYDIQYLDPNSTTISGVDTVRAKKNVADNVARHLTVGVEFVPAKAFSLRLGYNHLQGRELRLANTSGLAGLSFGAKIRVAEFQLDYTYAVLQAAGSSNYLTLSHSFGSQVRSKD